MEFQKNIYMVIRHQCKIEKLSYRRACAVQYYTTKVEINVNNNASFIEVSFTESFQVKKDLVSRDKSSFPR